jgi:hypothetical protein
MPSLSSNRYSVSVTGSIEFKAPSRFARPANSRVAHRAVPLSVFEIEARWREPYDRPRASTSAA